MVGVVVAALDKTLRCIIDPLGRLWQATSRKGVRKRRIHPVKNCLGR